MQSKKDEYIEISDSGVSKLANVSSDSQNMAKG